MRVSDERLAAILAAKAPKNMPTVLAPLALDLQDCRSALAAERERVKVLDFDLLGYHYWRECHKCGHAEGGYLHCMHDGFQNPCHMCGERMPTVAGECECKFVLTHEEISRATSAEPPKEPKA